MLSAASKYLIRNQSKTLIRSFSVGMGSPPAESENPVRFNFLYTRDNIKTPVLAREGESLLEVAHNNHVDLEGACA